MKAKMTAVACSLMTVSLCLSSCVVTTAQTVRAINDTSTFEIELLTCEKEIDFTDYQEVPGFGVTGYVTGYYDKKYETNDGTPVEECYVLYSVTPYPDCMSRNEYVTAICVSDPEVCVFGYSVGDNADDFQAHLQTEGFELYESNDRIRRFEKGKVMLYFGVNPETQTVREICVKLEITNVFGIIY